MSLSRRRFNQFLLGTLGASLLGPALADLVEGRDWRPIDPPQPGDTPGKIEVLEFFSYGCPHCMDLNPLITDWEKTLPDDVSFRRVPVTFGRTAWANLARLYLSLESMGELERLDQTVFTALHRERVKLYTKQTITDWVAKQGVDPKAFADIFDSFDIQTQLSRGESLVNHYRIDAVPTITIAGRYAVLGKGVKTLPDLLKIADELIAKARSKPRTE